MAQIILREFPDPQRLKNLEEFLEENWPWIELRRERKRPVGSPYKLATCIRSVAFWFERYISNISVLNFPDLWELADEVQFFGRYAKMKFLECLRQSGVVTAQIQDLRAKGGWSPREGLALLVPEEEEVLLRGGDKKPAIERIEVIANLLYEGFVNVKNLNIDRYEFQVFLCDYKQVAVTQRQYPGRSVDSELTYHRRLQEHFKLDDSMFKARAALFPPWALGEVQGWNGVREELGSFFVETNGRMWSDFRYDYLASIDPKQGSTFGLLNPVLREHFA